MMTATSDRNGSFATITTTRPSSVMRSRAKDVMVIFITSRMPETFWAIWAAIWVDRLFENHETLSAIR